MNSSQVPDSEAQHHQLVTKADGDRLVMPGEQSVDGVFLSLLIHVDCTGSRLAALIILERVIIKGTNITGTVHVHDSTTVDLGGNAVTVARKSWGELLHLAG